jgi:hypothetical protein
MKAILGDFSDIPGNLAEPTLRLVLRDAALSAAFATTRGVADLIKKAAQSLASK